MASKDESSKTQRTISPQADHTSPKKRRKVNHACIYCRRSHMTCDLDRPCARCVKRSIGHLCHDEQRDSGKGMKNDQANTTSNSGAAVKQENSLPYMLSPSVDQQQLGHQALHDSGANVITRTAAPDSQADNPQFLPQSSDPISQGQGQVFGDKNQQFPGYGDWSLGNQNQFSDMHSFHPSYMFNAPDITNEYNLLNEFLSSSLLDDPTVFPNDEIQALSSDTSLSNTLAASLNGGSGQSLLNSQQTQASGLIQGPLGLETGISRPKSVKPTDKEEEKYYMTVADPSGNDTPEERMNKVFMAKYNAGMLRPFNYIQGYARLHRYMDQNMQPASRQRILRQLDKFRPKFRERMQSLTDMELTFVEMWFERSLMEYDRVFASMAIPACCWRRTGEIFRGNKEMAELIHVPIEKLRDGKLALHEIIVEKDLVSYWDKFLAIAFDNSQKAMLTTCSLKNPDLKASDPEIKCCFSFTIRRDNHNIPSLIVGNFLPQGPRKT
ncbi:hypothetical protein HO173_004085 [Letharia columbiana]|uniref:Zn(2)-C6 fungal-type domain-containing protein n=1 Tax=Letharia columbiana TaxID=112416 RepID=A0A8H6FZW4_9LECA|nr:uncharacterized protein HO173_004085 [Letharia columbiana]KAF6237884.1 hypothetical protein HO173_004085 [Letharia columbiana]